MYSQPPATVRHRKRSLAGLLACIAAMALAADWFRIRAAQDPLSAFAMLIGFILASAIVCMRSPSLMMASVRLAVGSALLLAWAWAASIPRLPVPGWRYGPFCLWLAYWWGATVALPLLLVRFLDRMSARSWSAGLIRTLRQIPPGFLILILTILLWLTIGFIVDQVVPVFFPSPPPPPIT